MDSRKCAFAMVVVAVVSVLATNTYRDRQARTAPPAQPVADEAQPGSARLFGQLEKLESKDGAIVATVQLLRHVDGRDDLEEAHLIDGSCTLEQIERDGCLNNMYYLRPAGKTMTLTVSPDAEIKVFARVQGGGMSVNDQDSIYMETISTAAFVSGNKGSIYWQADTPYSLTTKNGVIVHLEETLTP